MQYALNHIVLHPERFTDGTTLYDDCAVVDRYSGGGRFMCGVTDGRCGVGHRCIRTPGSTVGGATHTPRFRHLLYALKFIDFRCV